MKRPRYGVVLLRRFWLLVPLGLLFLLSACQGGTQSAALPPTAAPYGDTVARIGSEVVTRAEYVYLLTGVLEEYALLSGGSIDWDAQHEGKPAAVFFKETALREASRAHALARKARDMDIHVSAAEEDDIKANIEQEIAYMGGEEAFTAYLRDLGTDRETHEFYNYRVPLLTEKLQALLFAPGGPQDPPEDTLRDFCETYFRKLSYIYLNALDNAGNPLTGSARTERRAEAEALRAEAAAGADFTELVIAHGADYLMLLTPEGITVPQGQNGEAFDKASAVLQTGDISPVVDAESGFYIILRRSDDADFYELNREAVLFEYQNHRFAALTEQWCTEAPAEPTELYQSFDIKDYAPHG